MPSKVLDIKIYPDPILRYQTDKVQHFDQDLHQLLDDMACTMYSADGIGLAAPQIGSKLRICVIDVSKESADLIELINPEIVKREDKISGQEGCLSIPEYRESVTRNAKVTVSAQDRNGKEFLLEAEGLLAVCLQHEIDHLDGILFIDHLSQLKRQLFKRWAKKQGWQTE